MHNIFNKDSVVVQAWVRSIKKEGGVTRDDIPNLANLRDVVNTILDSEED